MNLEDIIRKQIQIKTGGDTTKSTGLIKTKTSAYKNHINEKTEESAISDYLDLLGNSEGIEDQIVKSMLATYSDIESEDVKRLGQIILMGSLL